MNLLFKISFSMSISLFFIFIFLGFYWHLIKKRKVLPEIRKLKGQTENVLIKISPPLPYLSLAGILAIFTLFCNYLAENGALDNFLLGLNLLQLVSWILLFIVIVIYTRIRIKRNKINNHYYYVCSTKDIVFHPGDINNYPRIYDTPWSEKDMKRVIFINPTTNEIFDKQVNRKSNIFLASLLGGALLILFILQKIFT
jgi:hypothetical protein